MDLSANFIEHARVASRLPDSQSTTTLAAMVMDLCASVVESGSNEKKMLSKVADHIEHLSHAEQKFAGLIANACIKIYAEHNPNEKDDVGVEIRLAADAFCKQLT